MDNQSSNPVNVALLNSSSTIATQSAKRKLLTVDDIEALPDLQWLIDGVLPTQSLAILYGEPGSGKSFMALDMALACVNAQPWLKRATKHASVLYVAAEGAIGLKKRLKAKDQLEPICRDFIRFKAAPFQITKPEEISAFLTDLQTSSFRPSLIVVDTLARVAVGADENNAKDMGQIVAGFDEVKAKTNATILVIHHTRKGGDTERGSSALRGAADVMIKCSKLGDFANALTLECSKMKDDEPFPVISVGLTKVTLKDGSSSLVVGDLIDMLKHGDKFANVLKSILESKFGQTGASNGELLEAFRAETNKSKPTFDRALRTLKAANRIKSTGDNRNTRYYPIGVSVTSVSTECQIQTPIGVTSPPL